MKNISIFSSTLIRNLILITFLLLCTISIATFTSIKISNAIFKPLRRLNMKMRNIINDGMKRDLKSEENSSMEIGDLYEVFRSLIKTKKFENNDFMNKEDALAVIDLAEACKMFLEESQRNNKAAGICYNNIGNIQYKQGNFDQAAQNFKLAIDQA